MAAHDIPQVSLPGDSGAKLLDSRESLLHALGLKDKVCVEVGVLYGNFSAEILKHNPFQLYLVDPWENQGLAKYHDINSKDQQGFDDVYTHVTKRFSAEMSVRKIIPMRMYSHEAARRFGHADFVFIDGNHAYNWVLADLFCWYTRINKGGWLCGHDYKRSDFLGVEQAVDTFCKMTGLAVDYETNEESWTSFGIQVK